MRPTLVKKLADQRLPAGYISTRDNERSAVFEIPKAVVRVLKPRVKRELTERQREALKKGHSRPKALDIIQANEHEIADG